MMSYQPSERFYRHDGDTLLSVRVQLRAIDADPELLARAVDDYLATLHFDDDAPFEPRLGVARIHYAAGFTIGLVRSPGGAGSESVELVVSSAGEDAIESLHDGIDRLQQALASVPGVEYRFTEILAPERRVGSHHKEPEA